MQRSLAIAPLHLVSPHDGQHDAASAGACSQNTFSCHADAEETPPSFCFLFYRKTIFQALLEHDKIRHALSTKGKRVERFNQERRDGDEALFVQAPTQKGCRHKLKALHKTRPVYGGEPPPRRSAIDSDNAVFQPADLMSRRGRKAEKRTNTRYPAVPDAGFRTRPKVAGVSYDTSRHYWWAKGRDETGKAHCKNFSVGEHGAEKAYRLAVAFRRQIAGDRGQIRHPAVPDPDCRKRPKVSGVSYDARRHYWRTDWYAEDGKERTKCYSVGEHGAEKAYQLAVECRRKMAGEGGQIRHRPVPDIGFDRRPRVIGVVYDAYNCRWRADWQGHDKRCSKYFSVGEHGAEKAYQLAVQHRLKMLKEVERLKRASTQQT